MTGKPRNDEVEISLKDVVGDFLISGASVVAAATLERFKLLFGSSGVPPLINIALNIGDIQFVLIAIIGAIKMFAKLIKVFNQVGFTQTLHGLIQAIKNFRFNPKVQANIKNSLQWGVITGFGVICLSSIAFLIWLLGAKVAAVILLIVAIACLLIIFIDVVIRYGLSGGLISSISFVTISFGSALCFCAFIAFIFGSAFLLKQLDGLDILRSVLQNLFLRQITDDQ